jgi:hypothetical protein
MFGWVKNLVFKKKEHIEPPSLDTGPELEAISPLRERVPMPQREPLSPMEPLTTGGLPEREQVEMSNVKAKLDLILTEMDSLRIQNRNIDERLKAIEKALAEMRGIKHY